jgi:hypothetical protein
MGHLKPFILAYKVTVQERQKVIGQEGEKVIGQEGEKMTGRGKK